MPLPPPPLTILLLQQAQDRAHRIGQTRDVYIYRLVSEATIEENILLKARQKRQLAHMSLEEGQFTTAALFASVSVRDLVESGGDGAEVDAAAGSSTIADTDFMRALAAAEDDDDRAASKLAAAEARAEIAEFDEAVSEAAGVDASGGGEAAAQKRDDDADDDLPAPLPAASSGREKKDKARAGDAASCTDAASDDEAAAPARATGSGNPPDSSDDESGSAGLDSDDLSDAPSEGQHSAVSAEGKSSGKHVRFAKSAKPTEVSSAAAVQTRSTRATRSTAKGGCGKAPSKLVSALDRIDLDALALETTAAEEGLEADASAHAASAAGPAAAASNLAGSGRSGQQKQPSAQALFDAVTTGTGSAVVAAQQRDRVAIAMAKFAVVESSLQPAERYALRYRESRDPHPWVAPDVLREVEASFAVEERAWELEQLQAVAEDEERAAEADAELLQLSGGGGSAAGTAAGAELYARTLRDLRHGIKVRAATGSAWEERVDEVRQEKFFYNIDTKEAVWEKPLVLRARAATQRARQEGYAGLYHLPAVALRIMRFLEPAPDRLHRVARVCRSWHALSEHPALFKFVRQSGVTGARSSDAGPATLDPFSVGGPADTADALSEQAWSHPRRIFDNIPAAIAASVPGDTIVIASGSHYVPHPLEVNQPIRIVSQVSSSTSRGCLRISPSSPRSPRQGVRGCLFAGSASADADADDAEWLHGGGAWYPSLNQMPPSVARQLGLASGYISDAGFAAIGAALTSEVAVADSAVLRIDGPLVWRTRPARPQLPSPLFSAMSSPQHVIGNSALDQQTARALELYALTSGVSVSSLQQGTAVRARVGGGGQLRGITLRNVRPALPHCLVVAGPGPIVVLPVHEKHSPPQLIESAGASASVLPPSVLPSFAIADRSPALELASPLQVVQCDLGNRGGSGACVVANAGAALLLLACRVSSGSGSGLLVQVRQTLLRVKE